MCLNNQTPNCPGDEQFAEAEKPMQVVRIREERAEPRQTMKHLWDLRVKKEAETLDHLAASQ